MVVRTNARESGTRAALSLPAVPRLLAVLIACLALVLAGCGDSSTATSRAPPPPPEAADRSGARAANEFLPEGCEDVEKPAPKDVGEIKKPTEKLEQVQDLRRDDRRPPAATSRSRWTPSSAPITGGSFKYLADQKFFDGTDLPPDRARTS